MNDWAESLISTDHGLWLRRVQEISSVLAEQSHLATHFVKLSNMSDLLLLLSDG